MVGLLMLAGCQSAGPQPEVPIPLADVVVAYPDQRFETWQAFSRQTGGALLQSLFATGPRDRMEAQYWETNPNRVFDAVSRPPTVQDLQAWDFIARRQVGNRQTGEAATGLGPTPFALFRADDLSCLALDHYFNPPGSDDRSPPTRRLVLYHCRLDQWTAAAARAHLSALALAP